MSFIEGSPKPPAGASPANRTGETTPTTESPKRTGLRPSSRDPSTTLKTASSVRPTGETPKQLKARKLADLSKMGRSEDLSLLLEGMSTDEMAELLGPEFLQKFLNEHPDEVDSKELERLGREIENASKDDMKEIPGDSLDHVAQYLLGAVSGDPVSEEIGEKLKAAAEAFDAMEIQQTETGVEVQLQDPSNGNQQVTLKAGSEAELRSIAQQFLREAHIATLSNESKTASIDAALKLLLAQGKITKKDVAATRAKMQATLDKTDVASKFLQGTDKLTETHSDNFSTELTTGTGSFGVGFALDTVFSASAVKNKIHELANQPKQKLQAALALKQQAKALIAAGNTEEGEKLLKESNRQIRAQLGAIALASGTVISIAAKQTRGASLAANFFSRARLGEMSIQEALKAAGPEVKELLVNTGNVTAIAGGTFAALGILIGTVQMAQGGRRAIKAGVKKGAITALQKEYNEKYAYLSNTEAEAELLKGLTETSKRKLNKKFTEGAFGAAQGATAIVSGALIAAASAGLSMGVGLGVMAAIGGALAITRLSIMKVQEGQEKQYLEALKLLQKQCLEEKNLHGALYCQVKSELMQKKIQERAIARKSALEKRSKDFSLTAQERAEASAKLMDLQMNESAVSLHYGVSAHQAEPFFCDRVCPELIGMSGEAFVEMVDKTVHHFDTASGDIVDTIQSDADVRKQELKRSGSLSYFPSSEEAAKQMHPDFTTVSDNHSILPTSMGIELQLCYAAEKDPVWKQRILDTMKTGELGHLYRNIKADPTSLHGLDREGQEDMNILRHLGAMIRFVSQDSQYAKKHPIRARLDAGRFRRAEKALQERVELAGLRMLELEQEISQLSYKPNVDEKELTGKKKELSRETRVQQTISDGLAKYKKHREIAERRIQLEFIGKGDTNLRSDLDK